MKRREFVHTALAVAAARACGARNATDPGPLPRRDRIRVAFLLGPDTNVIDTAGPWEVFQDVMVMNDGHHSNPFELVTVAPSREPLAMTAGLRVIPQFTFDDVPLAHVIVVPAQKADDEARRWLRGAAAGLTSGIDLALHVTARYFDRQTAQATAHYLEHESPRWQ